MSDLTPPEPTLPEPPRRDRIVWTALASVMLHAGVLASVLWQPLPPSAEAAPPPAIDVVLVPPPEAVSAGEPPPSEEPAEEASAEPATTPPAETTSAAPPPETESSAEATPEESASEAPDKSQTPEAKPAEEASAPSPAAAGTTEAKETAETTETTESSASTAAATPPAAQAAAAAAPSPLPRPANRIPAPATAASTGPSSEPVAALEAESAEAGGGIVETPSAEPDVATLELGEVRNAERFYLEAMLQEPSLARAREAIKTLPRDKRLAQTCNIEALAQVGYSGEGFAPDLVMTDAYALSEMAGTSLSATGAIFRSQDKWYGLAFDCTLSDDLTTVTSFSYRLGADVTEAVLARLGKR